MNEWGFAAEIKSWWDAAMAAEPSWDLVRCGVEDQVDSGLNGSPQRSDLTLHDRSGVILAGELRLPDHAQADPWDPENLGGAITKAQHHGARWAFTSDAVTFLLIDTQIVGTPQQKVVSAFPVGTTLDRAALDMPSAQAEAKRLWSAALAAVMPVLRGQVKAPGIAPDERFIRSLHGLLRRPRTAIADALDRRRLADPKFAAELVRWMVDEQGWAHVEKEWAREIRQTADLTAYVFVARLMFYEALRGAQPTLSKLDIGADVPAVVARGTVKAFFEDARVKSRDYETIFKWDVACEYALIDESSIPGWSRVIERLHNFELATIAYDVIGRMFERLIEPHERYRYGQHYTEPEVVDLMLSFALPTGHESLADFAAGGGTFLVRGYARKKHFVPQLTHQQMLGTLYGTDISAFASSLATINLAVRDLSFDANYPRVTNKSFFRLEPGERLMQVPDAGGGMADVVIPPLDAVSCNPPYVRVQRLSPPQRAEVAAILGRASPLPHVPPRVNGLANYHLYFWFHAARFLRPDGRLAFITSGEWLDSDYGAVLQQWLLDNFRVQAFVESMAEPWFTEARVGTVVCVAERCDDPQLRDDNVVRFVTLRTPLTKLYGVPPDSPNHFARVDTFRDRILALTDARGEGDDFDWRCVTQAELRALGTVTA